MLYRALTRTFLAFACVLLVAGCAGHLRSSAPFNASLDEPYRLDSGDRVRIIVFGQNDLSNSFSVDGAGSMALPLVGSVDARGLTTQELERAIATKLKAGFLRDPHVTAEVEIYRPFFAMGEVNTPGRYAFVNGLTGREAVAIAGGFTPRAVKDRIRVSREYQGRTVEATVPLDSPVRPGDTVQVIERWF
ncbi:MAG: polysaccharide export protein [Rhodobiaceae bacterium]|nr:polysaccharide export protein [Rhodobiaceae bacterium]